MCFQTPTLAAPRGTRVGHHRRHRRGYGCTHCRACPQAEKGTNAHRRAFVMGSGPRIAAVVTVLGGVFALYYTMLSMGVFGGFETEIGNSNVAQLAFMCLVVMVAV